MPLVVSSKLKRMGKAIGIVVGDSVSIEMVAIVTLLTWKAGLEPKHLGISSLSAWTMQANILAASMEVYLVRRKSGLLLLRPRRNPCSRPLLVT